MNEQNNQNIYGPNSEQKKGNVLFLVLSFFFPIIGFILFFVWMNSNKENAKMALVGSIIGFFVGVISSIAITFVFINSFNDMARNINDDVDKIEYIREYDFERSKPLDFKESLAAEEIELKYTDYQETDDQVTIYLFRGQGCHYCKDFLNFLNDNAQEYGKYFKVRSFEVWSDDFNNNLLEVTSNFLNKPAGGVPYIIIGNKVFAGYAPSYNEEILTTIKDNFEAGNMYKYDVFEEMKEQRLIK